MSALVSDVTKAIFGIWLIAKNQPGADKFFDISVEGFWRSFVAAILVLPANIIITALGILAAGDVSYSVIDGLRDLLIYIINWLFYFLQFQSCSRFYEYWKTWAIKCSFNNGI